MVKIANYEKIKEDSVNFYKKVNKMACPAFNNENVFFNSEGFNHLIYKRERSERSKGDQIMKFILLPVARDIIKISTTYQEYEEGLMAVVRKKFGKRVEENLMVKYWGMVAIIKFRRVKVIIRQIGNGNKHFWSVMPAWKTSQYRDIKIISLAKGDLGND